MIKEGKKEEVPAKELDVDKEKVGKGGGVEGMR